MSEYRRTWLRLAILAILLAGGQLPILLADDANPLRVGWHGYVHLGRWTPVRIPAELGQIQRLETVDPQGHRVEWNPQPTSAGTCYVRFGRPEAELNVRLQQAGRALELQPETPTVLPASARLILTVGTLKGFEFAEADRESGTAVPYFVAPLETSAELPTDPRGYDSVAYVVFSGLPDLTEAQSAALRMWVGQGGRLVLALPQESTSVKASPLAAWLPFAVADEPVIVRGVGRLEAFSGKNVRIPLPPRQTMLKVTAPDGVVLAAERDDLLLARIPFGFGAVTVMTLQLPRLPLTAEASRAPLSKWLALPDFCRQLVEAPLPNLEEARRTRRLGTELSSSGITDLASQIHAVQEFHPTVQRTTPWPAMGWMLILIALLAGADFAIVHLLLRRPHATWVTLPAMIAVACGLSAWAAQRQNGDAWRSNVLEIVDVDTPTSLARVQTWVDVYSPETRKRSLEVRPADVSWLKPDASAGAWPAALTWDGIPETVFGGMYRTGGMDFQQSRYRVAAANRLDDLPWLQWSTYALTNRWSATATPPVEASLKYVGVGRLSGTIRNASGVALEDWLIAYGNRFYRKLQDREGGEALPLHPDEVWSLDGADVVQQNLRGALTRTTASIVDRAGDRMKDVRTEQGRYDPLNLDATELIRLLTFHEEIGGTGYTGLTNHVLEDRDATRQLELRRAVLFARVNLPMSRVALDGAEVAPDRRFTYLRVVLPVEQAGEVRYLQRLE